LTRVWQTRDSIPGLSSGSEDHTFGLINVREHFPEEELTLGKNRLLEVDILVECGCIELIGIKMVSRLE